MRRLEGIPASDGIAAGGAFVYHPVTVVATVHVVTDTWAELARLHDAVARAREQLDEVHRGAVVTIGEAMAAIFQAQQLMLDDPELLRAVEDRIREGENAEAALMREIDHHATELANLENSYLRERAMDLRDVGQRVLRALAGLEENTLPHLDSPAILVASDLTPSETTQLNREMTMAFATAHGGATSHTAILARNLGLPAVVGLGKDLLDVVRNGMSIVVDGYAGVVIVDPDRATLDEYLGRMARGQAAYEAARSAALSPAVTHDGHQVAVVANIGDIASAETALAHGAEGVGLLRTEFLFLNRATLPDEEEQYAAYRAIAATMGSRPLVFRTLDVGGDKPSPHFDFGKEANPFLGFRAIRVSLAHPEILRTQLRAILRAGVGHNAKVMFPMVTTVEEVYSARQLLEEARSDLEGRSIAFVDEIEVGIMVEVPSAAICAAMLARQVDFFSLGTNDLVQYTLAADRTNERVGYLYDPLHPAILHLVKNVIDAAHHAGKWVGMCGEMAGDLDAVPLLLGMGLDEFSVNAAQIPKVKGLLRSLGLRATQELVMRALELSTATEIRGLVRGWSG